jgi:hypothetical protein
MTLSRLEDGTCAQETSNKLIAFDEEMICDRENGFGVRLALLVHYWRWQGSGWSIETILKGVASSAFLSNRAVIYCFCVTFQFVTPFEMVLGQRA